MLRASLSSKQFFTQSMNIFLKMQKKSAKKYHLSQMLYFKNSYFFVHKVWHGQKISVRQRKILQQS